MLDDGEAKPGAAGFARAAAVNAVKTLGNARYVFRCNADAGVAHFEHGMITRVIPAQGYFAPRRRVTNGVACQIAECTGKLGFTAQNLGCRINLQVDLARSCTQSKRIVIYAPDKRSGIHRLFLERILRAFKLRKREQIVDQTLHAVSLGFHQLEKARYFGIIRRQVFQRFQETAQHCKRGTQLVRDIGDEVPAHRFHLFQLRDIARDQEFLLGTVRNDLQRQYETRVARRFHNQRFARIAMSDELDDLGLAYQVGERLADIMLRVQPQVAGGTPVEPFDVVIAGKDHHAVGHCLRGLAHPRQRSSEVIFSFFALAHTPVKVRKCLFPHPAAQRYRYVHIALRPAFELGKLVGVVENQE